ncbi:MAG: alpha/beta fold hydrolase [Planctomycetaceae bacterium]|nr:alpha/beta fold hydrolase [Planctomycetaceae bacterium]
MKKLVALAILCTLCVCAAVHAGNYPEPNQGDFVLKDFTFHTGEKMPELRVHYRTIGDASNPAVLVLHGTTGNGGSMLSPSFADQFFGPGQALDASKYYIILPDAIGTGQTSKPSDGLRGAFPRYNYDDMVLAHYRLLTEGLGVKHLRVIVGNSMGGMHAWVWATNYPDFMDAIVPLASQPTAMASRNWIMRRMIIDAVRNDPAWNNGFYDEQPQHFRMVNVWYGIATNGGSLSYNDKAPTREAADKLLADRMAKQTTMDANDFVLQWDASRDYDPVPKLDRIKCRVLAINSADDERCPVESDLMEKTIARIPNASFCIVPGGPNTAGHGTVMNAALWRPQMEAFMQCLP